MVAPVSQEAEELFAVTRLAADLVNIASVARAATSLGLVATARRDGVYAGWCCGRQHHLLNMRRLGVGYSGSDVYDRGQDFFEVAVLLRVISKGLA